MSHTHSGRRPRWSLAVGASLLLSAQAYAGMVTDREGNVGYDSAAECDAAVAAGTARFYEPFTSHPPLRRAGEASVRALRLSELAQATELAAELGYDPSAYAKGACDIGVGRSGGRDGVSPALIGKWVPYGPAMSVNAYFDSQGRLVRATMQQCDNNFAKALPRPVGAQRVAAGSECFANVLIPAKFETKTEQVVKVPATQRVEVVPPTFKTVTEQVLVSPEFKRQIPVPATYKTVEEEIVVKPASFREEPVPATYKMVSERVVVRPETKRLEVVPATYKTVTERVLVSPERKELVAIAAEYGEQDEEVVVQPATTRVTTVPPTYRTETERVLQQAESVRYEPIALPLRTVREELVRTEASSRLQVQQAKLRTVTERVVVREASKRLVPVPAVYETVTERVKVADARREWKRGQAWVGQAIQVRPLRTFKIDASGRAEGFDVEQRVVEANNEQLDDDVMCLVEVPARYDTISRQVLKTPATVREEIVPAEYATVQRQVMDSEAQTREIEVPATYQTVTRREIDTDKLRAQGYRFDDKGVLVATPGGERILAAADVMGTAAAAVATRPGAKPQEADEADAPLAFVREVRVPAQYQTVTRRVVDQPAQVRTVEVPAVTQTVKSRVVVKPARTEERVIAAQYQTVERQVVDRPASTREVVEPAQYATVEREVVDRPASTRRIPVPEVREKVKRQVVATPATFREEVVPAVYRSVTRQVIDQAASTKSFTVPAQYESISYQVKVADARTESRSVLCETNATPAKIREIQQALRRAGFNPGEIDGVMRAQTMQAVNRYQQAKGLPVDGFLNLDTVKALGVSPF